MVYKLNNRKIIFLKLNTLSFRPFQDCSKVLVAGTWIPHWALRSRILDVWFLVSAQLSCHSINVMFSPPLRIGIVLLLFLKDSEQSVLRDSELQSVSTFALLPPALSCCCHSLTLVLVSWEWGGGTSSLILCIWFTLLGSNNWVKLGFWNIYEFRVSAGLGVIS